MQSEYIVQATSIRHHRVCTRMHKWEQLTLPVQIHSRARAIVRVRVHLTRRTCMQSCQIAIP